jgi:hypothetical protein
MKSLSDHSDLPYKLPIFLLIRKIFVGGTSVLVWLIKWVKHAMWADSLYLTYLVLLSITKILASFQLCAPYPCWASD